MYLLNDIRWRSWHKLDDARRNSRLGEDFVYDIVRIGRCRRRLPDNDVPDESRCSRKVSSDGGKVEWRNSENESFETAVFDTAIDNRVRSDEAEGNL